MLDDNLFDQQEYKDMRDDYVNYSNEKFETFKLFNGAIMAVSTAFLGGIAAFLNQLKTLCGINFLYVASILFTATIIMSILELYLSQIAYQKAMENLAAMFKEHEYVNDRKNRYAKCCWWLILSSAVTASLALMFICVFFSSNLTQNGDIQMPVREEPLIKSFPSPPPPRPSATPQPTIPANPTPQNPTPNSNTQK